MALSFTTVRPCDDGRAMPHTTVLVTGAAGTHGADFARRAQGRYTLRLMVQPGTPSDHLAGFGEVVACDLADLAALHHVCQGIDTVVHLAGAADPSALWSDLLTHNIIGTYHLFTAAKAAGCRRVVYASSLHAVSGYPTDVQVKPTDPVNPGDLYGVSKCFGEALGRYLAEQEGLSVIAIRIGAFLPPQAAADDQAIGVLDTFISPADFYDLLTRAIDDRSLHWALLHGLSDNQFKRLDISTARELLGYAPRDDAARLPPRLAVIDVAERIVGHNVNDERQHSGLREDLERLRP